MECANAGSVEEAKSSAEKCGQHAEESSVAAINAKSFYESARAAADVTISIEEDIRSKYGDLLSNIPAKFDNNEEIADNTESFDSTEVNDEISKEQQDLHDEETRKALIHKTLQEIAWSKVDAAATENSFYAASEFAKVAMEAAKAASVIASFSSDKKVSEAANKAAAGADESRNQADVTSNSSKLAADTLTEAEKIAKRISDPSISLLECTELTTKVEELRNEVSHLKSDAKTAEAKAKLGEEAALYALESTRAFAKTKEDDDKRNHYREKIEQELVNAQSNYDSSTHVSSTESNVSCQKISEFVDSVRKLMASNADKAVKKEGDVIVRAGVSAKKDRESLKQIDDNSISSLKMLKKVVADAKDTDDLDKLKSLVEKSENIRLDISQSSMDARNLQVSIKLAEECAQLGYESCISILARNDEDKKQAARHKVQQESEWANVDLESAQKACEATLESATSKLAVLIDITNTCMYDT